DSGSGKTHLALVWKELSKAFYINGQKIINNDPFDLPDCNAFIIDDADFIEDEIWLLNFYNTLKEQKASLLITARTSPAFWNTKLPDLASRLQTFYTLEMTSPHDDVLKSVFLKQAKEKGLIISDAIIKFLLNHAERSFQSMCYWLCQIDYWSAIKKRSITLQFVREIFYNQH
ncbi:MAG: HdaA/DnaA family protein, partial [Alphaproteobacteria bacterium]